VFEIAARRQIGTGRWMRTTGALEIGNWTPSGGDPIEPIRAFNGRMDEFLVFSRALHAEEIARLWATGRPF
jgi:hypothetical protein